MLFARQKITNPHKLILSYYCQTRTWAVACISLLKCDNLPKRKNYENNLQCRYCFRSGTVFHNGTFFCILDPVYTLYSSQMKWAGETLAFTNKEHFPSPLAASPHARRSREITPPDRRWLNARRPASDSMPAGPPLTQARRIAADSSPPDRRWLMPAGSPLTQAHRIGTDSCPLAASIPSPVDLVHLLRPGVPF